MTVKVCAIEGCGVEFDTKTSKRYCSPEHRQQARRCAICKTVKLETKSPYCRPCGAELARFKRTDPAIRARTLAHLRRKTYGIDQDEYLAMLDGQGGVCAICAQPETATRRGEVKALSVDHDHATGAIRGLLCQNCNTAIGLLGDNPERLQAAISYLTR